MCVGEDKLYVFGGCILNGRLNDFYELNLKSFEWRKLPTNDKISPRGGPSIACNGKKLIVSTGFSGIENNDIFLFDI